MKLEIKKYNELSIDELYNIIKLRVDVFVVEQNCPYHECDDLDKMAVHIFYVCNEEVTSYLRILPPGLRFDEPSIGRVVVNSKYRGNGLARKIMNEAIEYITTMMKENSIKISAQHYLIDFYKELGFNVDSDIYLEDNIPHINMVY